MVSSNALWCSGDLVNPACSLHFHSLRHATEMAASQTWVLLAFPLSIVFAVTTTPNKNRPSWFKPLGDISLLASLFVGAATLVLAASDFVTGPGSAWQRWGLVAQAAKAGWPAAQSAYDTALLPILLAVVVFAVFVTLLCRHLRAFSARKPEAGKLASDAKCFPEIRAKRDEIARLRRQLSLLEMTSAVYETARQTLRTESSMLVTVRKRERDEKIVSLYRRLEVAVAELKALRSRDGRGDDCAGERIELVEAERLAAQICQEGTPEGKLEALNLVSQIRDDASNTPSSEELAALDRLRRMAEDAAMRRTAVEQGAKELIETGVLTPPPTP